VALGFCNCAQLQGAVVSMADDCRCSEMAAKKIKLQEEAISEILVADTDSENISFLFSLAGMIKHNFYTHLCNKEMHIYTL
jgi:predicted nucleic acid-binding Zn finger protein